MITVTLLTNAEHGEEERKIRQDPAGTGSAILTKVFGSLLG